MKPHDESGEDKGKIESVEIETTAGGERRRVTYHRPGPGWFLCLVGGLFLIALGFAELRRGKRLAALEQKVWSLEQAEAARRGELDTTTPIEGLELQDVTQPKAPR